VSNCSVDSPLVWQQNDNVQNYAALVSSMTIWKERDGRARSYTVGYFFSSFHPLTLIMAAPTVCTQSLASFSFLPSVHSSVMTRRRGGGGVPFIPSILKILIFSVCFLMMTPATSVTIVHHSGSENVVMFNCQPIEITENTRLFRPCWLETMVSCHRCGQPCLVSYHIILGEELWWWSMKCMTNGMNGWMICPPMLTWENARASHRCG